MFNEVSFEGTCPRCGTAQKAWAQFRYGHLFGYRYSVGDEVNWARPQVGDPAVASAAAAGTAICPSCGFNEWEVDVVVSDGRIAEVRTPSRISYPEDMFTKLDPVPPA